MNIEEAVSFRKPLAVKEILMLPSGYSFPRCPRCRVTLEREYQRFCDRCGQHLDWNNFDNAIIVKFQG